MIDDGIPAAASALPSLSSSEHQHFQNKIIYWLHFNFGISHTKEKRITATVVFSGLGKKKKSRIPLNQDQDTTETLKMES